MVDDVASERKGSTQNSGGNDKKSGETKSVKSDKENGAFVQVSLSIFSGIIGGMAVNILEGKALWTHVVIILTVGLIVWGVTAFSGKLSKKIGIPILIALLLMVMAAIGCFSHCIQN